MSGFKDLNRAQFVKDLSRDEGVRLAPYKDIVGKLTIGIGRNLDDMGITLDEAQYLLNTDITRTITEAERLWPWLGSLDEPRLRACLNMVFNLGTTKFGTFGKLHAALKAGDWQLAHDEALNSKWATQVGARAERIANVLLNG